MKIAKFTLHFKLVANIDAYAVKQPKGTPPHIYVKKLKTIPEFSFLTPSSIDQIVIKRVGVSVMFKPFFII